VLELWFLGTRFVAYIQLFQCGITTELQLYL